MLQDKCLSAPGIDAYEILALPTIHATKNCLLTALHAISDRAFSFGAHGGKANTVIPTVPLCSPGGGNAKTVDFTMFFGGVPTVPTEF